MLPKPKNKENACGRQQRGGQVMLNNCCDSGDNTGTGTLW